MSSYDESARTLHPTAAALLLGGDPGGALDALQGGSDPAARRLAGRALLALGDRAGARRAFLEALELAAGDPAGATLAREGLAAVARADGELREAATHLDAALDLAPPQALHLLHRDAAALAQRRGALSSAERHAAHALATAPDRGGAAEAADRVRLGSILGELGRHEEAIRELGRAVALLAALHGPAHVEVAAARTELADAHEAAGQLDEATAHHEAVLAHRIAAVGATHGSLAPHLLALATLEAARGDLGRSRAWAERAVLLLRGRVPAGDAALRRALALASG